MELIFGVFNIGRWALLQRQRVSLRVGLVVPYRAIPVFKVREAENWREARKEVSVLNDRNL